jgi:hypothetical protein
VALNTFVLEVTTPDGRTELHGCGVGGVPEVTAEEVVKHLGDLGHYHRRARKVTVKHRSAIVRKDVAHIHEVKAKDLPEVKFEVHPDANKHDLKPPENQPEAVAVESNGEVKTPGGPGVTVEPTDLAQRAPDDQSNVIEENVARSEAAAKEDKPDE